MRNKMIFSALIIILVLSACGGSNEVASGDGESNVLTLDLVGLEALQNGFHYEGWAIVDGQPFTTGKFNIDANGNLVTMSGAMDR